ncbi:ABC transporter permease [Emticicia sp. SJ17W-69]|uniref:ABC transporter permease n=1 Tax=Emticicia sp. SJ17W-69 TaxID=3421657 RepID=UPI003EBCC4D4
MIRNYLKIAWRNLSRNKVFSFINIAGLSIGLACCMLILLYTKDEVSFDKFHEKKDNLYQITCKITEKDGRVTDYGIASMIQGPTFKEEIPEIEACVRVNERDYVVKKGNETFYEMGSWVDDNFFTVFSFPLIEGNPKTVLSDIHSVVLTEEIAEKYFGKTNAIGKVMQLEIDNKFEPFVVSGIAKNAPQNSSIQFKMLLPFKYYQEKNNDDHWLNLNYPSYFVLNPKANIKNVEAKMAQVFASKAGKEIVEERKHGFDASFVYGVNPLLDMHLNTKYVYTAASNPIYSYILSGIALFILLIACINFVNLTVAQSLRRGKEIGIRKVVGGERKQLIWQFLGESFVLCFIAFSLAFLLAQLALPVFNELANKRLELSYLLDYQLIIGFVLLFVLTVFAAGFYPSLVLSGFDPVKTLYNRFKFSDKNYLSKGLVVLQFSLATFMIITTFFIYNQFDYLTHKSLGYNDKNLLVVSVGQDDNQALQQTFKNEFSKIPGIQSVALRQNGFWGTGSKANGKDIPVAFEHIDENYLSTLQIPLAAGRNFSKGFPSDSTNSVLVNEAYVKEAGWKGSGVGKTIDFLNGQATKILIVGVVKDYHYGSLREKIRPQLFSMQPKMGYGRFLLRIDPKNKPKTLAAIERIYHSLVPYRPFKYDYMEDMNFKNYESEAKWKQIIGFGAILMIFISCIGLFGLTMLSIQQRTKEIGIRKVLGATIFQISSLLSKNYIGLVFIAFVVAIPAAWYATTQWLENFAYKIDISWQIFALAAILTIVIAFLTVSYQAVRAALMNPTKSLKTE